MVIRIENNLLMFNNIKFVIILNKLKKIAITLIHFNKDEIKYIKMIVFIAKIHNTLITIP